MASLAPCQTAVVTGSVDQIPKATTEWTAQPGDARRATLSILRQPALWKRLLTFTTVVAAIAATVCVVNGSGWLVGSVIFAGAAAVYAAFAVLVSLVCAYIPNRRVLRTGSRWPPAVMKPESVSTPRRPLSSSAAATSSRSAWPVH